MWFGSPRGKYFYFSKLFSEAMGMPVTGYIRIRKLQYAVCSLLEGKKVLDVSLMYAFDSHEGFTRSFTQLFGSTPSTVKRYLASYSVPEYVVPDKEGSEKFMESKDNVLVDNMHQMRFQQDYIRGIAQHDIVCEELEHTSGMEMILKPDSQIFGDLPFSVQTIREWVEENVKKDGNLIVSIEKEI